MTDHSSSSSSPDSDPKPDPPPVDYPLLILLNIIHMIGSLPMFAALFFLKLETGVKELTILMLYFTLYNIYLATFPLLGIAASYFRRRDLVRAHVVIFMTTLTLATIGFLMFFSHVSIGGGHHDVIPTTIRNATDYSSWLRGVVENDPQLWSEVKMDLVKDKLCEVYVPPKGVDRAVFPPMYIGCCINSCKLERYKYNANSCHAWNEDPAVLCYDCDSCKAAALGEMNFRLALVVPLIGVTLAFHVFTTVVALVVSFFII